MDGSSGVAAQIYDGPWARAILVVAAAWGFKGGRELLFWGLKYASTLQAAEFGYPQVDLPPPRPSKVLVKAFQILCALLCVAPAYRFGISIEYVCAVFFVVSMLGIAVVDGSSQFLPDRLTKPVYFLGFAVNIFGYLASFKQAAYGAVAAYVFLAGLSWAFHRLTGREGMGEGDPLLAAGIGAWLGLDALPGVFVSTYACALVFIGLNRNRENSAMPFGPFLACGAIISVLFGPQLQYQLFHLF